jgi:hypothetical protein
VGYRRPSKTYRLTFEDEPELEVLARSVPIGELLNVMELADKMTGAPKKDDVESLFTMFAGRMISWNLEEENGTPVPANAAGVLGQDFDFALKLILAWVQAVSSVAAPLVTTSTGTTANPMEAQIPMTTPASPAGT